MPFSNWTPAANNSHKPLTGIFGNETTEPVVIPAELTMRSELMSARIAEAARILADEPIIIGHLRKIPVVKAA